DRLAGKLVENLSISIRTPKHLATVILHPVPGERGGVSPPSGPADKGLTPPARRSRPPPSPEACKENPAGRLAQATGTPPPPAEGQIGHSEKDQAQGRVDTQEDRPDRHLHGRGDRDQNGVADVQRLVHPRLVPTGVHRNAQSGRKRTGD